ncbi:MAG TPA: hypothetical protein VM660_07065 [Bacillus sp. (in: firmicutes)]|nr:hypothetical protein [Bacillus sp. (in: firmicutes)]
MSKYNTSSNNNNDSNTSFSYNTNVQNNNQQQQQQQEFNESVNRALDQTKDNINRSIDESKKQIPHYNDIVNSYLEQTLQSVKEITENYIETQKSIISSLQSAWRPYQQNVNTTVNSWNSPESVANAYSRFVSTFADNTVSALRTTNNIIFSNFDSWKSVMQQAKDNSKQIFNQNVNAAKTFEQNTRELTAAAQDSVSRFNTDNSSSSSSSDDGNTTTTTTTTYSTPSSKNTSNKKI